MLVFKIDVISHLPFSPHLVTVQLNVDIAEVGLDAYVALLFGLQLLPDLWCV